MSRRLAAVLAPVVLLAPLTSQCAGPTPGVCSSYAPLFRANGLPVSTFTYIARRESGCNHLVFVDNRTDLGGGLLGLNLRTSSLRAGWYAWCGLTVGNVTNAETNVRCAAVAYRKMGLRPWS